MEREARYAVVGAFVILIATMAAMFVYWYSEGRDRRSYVTYEIYFEGSVTGLSEGGSVRYLGVEVGRVRRIRLDKRSATRVQVVVEIDKDTPISRNTTAELSSLSLATGLLYIDLRQYGGKRELLPPVPSERYPVIATVRSNFDSFINRLPELAGSIASLVDRMQEILSPANTAALTDTLNSLHAAAGQLPATMHGANDLLQDLRLTAGDTRKLIASLQDTTSALGPNVTQMVERLNSTAANLDKAGVGINRFIDENSSAVGGFARDGLPQMQRMVEEARQAAAEFRELSRSLKENPSQLVYQKDEGGVKVPK